MYLTKQIVKKFHKTFICAHCGLTIDKGSSYQYCYKKPPNIYSGRFEKKLRIHIACADEIKAELDVLGETPVHPTTVVESPENILNNPYCGLPYARRLKHVPMEKRFSPSLQPIFKFGDIKVCMLCGHQQHQEEAIMTCPNKHHGAEAVSLCEFHERTTGTKFEESEWNWERAGKLGIKERKSVFEIEPNLSDFFKSLIQPNF